MLETKCIEWYNNVFKTCDLYKAMEVTIENSPWHRERNVAVHTDMVVSHYINLVDGMWHLPDVVGFLVCVFHDVGKPSSEIIKESNERGKYKAYHGHEKVSSRLWENYIMSNPDLIKYLGLSYLDIYNISWMIEYHLPYGIIDKNKYKSIVATVKNMFDANGSGGKVFSNVLMADAYGRNSDGYDEKIIKVIDWCHSFKKAVDEYVNDIVNEQEKVVYVPIGASASGKSTFHIELQIMLCKELVSYSLDTLRLDWYNGKDYAECYKLANEDTNFMDKARSEYMKLLKTNKVIYVDNTNISKKNRAFYIHEARKKGYGVVGIVFPLPLETIIERQINRTDKVISPKVSKNMYMNINQPSLGEFDYVMVVK